MAFPRSEITRIIKKILTGFCSFFKFLWKHWGKITIGIGILGFFLVWIGKSDSWVTLAASITSSFSERLLTGKTNQENQEINRASNPIYIDAGITSEDEYPITFWNDEQERKNIIIKNKSERVLSSTDVEGANYQIGTNIKISYQNKQNQTINTFEKPLREQINIGDSKYQSIDFPVPGIISGEIKIQLVCSDARNLCDTSRAQIWKRDFEVRHDIKDAQTIIVDATFGKEKDSIEIETFREKFNSIFNIDQQESEKILKAVYSTDAVRENTLGGAIVLANPAKYPGDNDILVQTLKNIIRESYTHLSNNVIFNSYNESSFKNSTYLLSGCVIGSCPNGLRFQDLDPYKNPFSEGIFQANPNLDFLIIIPAASDIKKNN